LSGHLFSHVLSHISQRHDLNIRMLVQEFGVLASQYAQSYHSSFQRASHCEPPLILCGPHHIDVDRKRRLAAGFINNLITIDHAVLDLEIVLAVLHSHGSISAGHRKKAQRRNPSSHR
jgi:hypothetical protein